MGSMSSADAPIVFYRLQGCPYRERVAGVAVDGEHTVEDARVATGWPEFPTATNSRTASGSRSR